MQDDLVGFLKHVIGMCSDEKSHVEISEELWKVIEIVRAENPFHATGEQRETSEGDAKQLYEIAKAIEVGWDTSQWKRPAIPEELRAIANRLPGKPALPLPEQRGMTPEEAEGQK